MICILIMKNYLKHDSNNSISPNLPKRPKSDSNLIRPRTILRASSRATTTTTTTTTTTLRVRQTTTTSTTTTTAAQTTTAASPATTTTAQITTLEAESNGQFSPLG